MIAIVDYDIGNLGAIANMLQRVKAKCAITADPAVVEKADKLILPGNGAFDACMRNLQATGLIPLLQHRVLECGVPLLGICVGAQMLCKSSEEGSEPGLGWIDATVRRFPPLPGLHIPHMGWNEVAVTADGHPLTAGLGADTRFYFIHSYYIEAAEPAEVILRATHGIEFAAAVARGSVAGVQFHPEKSHRFGKRLLQNFAASA